MSYSSNISKSEEQEKQYKLSTIDIIIAYIPLLIILFGFTGNTISFIIFRFENDLKNISSMVYLSFCCLTDSLS